MTKHEHDPNYTGILAHVPEILAIQIQLTLDIAALMGIPLSIAAIAPHEGKAECDVYNQPIDVHFNRELVGTHLISAVEDFREIDHICRHGQLLEDTLAFWIKRSRALGFTDPSPPQSAPIPNRGSPDAKGG